ncbi:MAG: NDP-sugar synthase [Chloroflexota bacterium]|nr:MAG: NDP-sugar synthase [Chloroflexota bacterium]
MQAIILVGGEGTRLRPLTCNTPKPMVPIANRPFLERMMTHLKSHGITDIILAMCYLPDRIQNYFGDGSDLGLKITYVMEPLPLGTAGAIKNIADQVELTDSVLVFNGDVLTDVDLGAMLDFHVERHSMATIALTPVEDPTPYGVVQRDAEGRVQRFIEKPGWDAITSNLINAGIYVIEPSVLRYAPPHLHFMFESGLFPVLLQVGEPVYGYPTNAYWIDIGTPQRYLAVHHDLLMGQIRMQFQGEARGNNVWVGADSIIDPTAKITGPVVIGNNCTIGRNARLTGPVVMGDGCTVGADCVLEDVVLWQGAEIHNQVMLKTCVIADHTNIGDNSWITNGAIIGDCVTVGSGNRLEHGIKIWPHRTIEPSTITF